MREQRKKDPEGYKQKQREYHYNKYHNDAAYRERTLQRFKDKQAQKDALLLPNMKKPRGRPPVAILDDNLNLVSVH